MAGAARTARTRRSGLTRTECVFAAACDSQRVWGHHPL